jgi:KipI family sensor histidine kinase inhibitor
MEQQLSAFGGARATDLIPLGDRGFLARFPSEPAAAAWAAAVRANGWTAVTDVVLAYQTVGVHVDPDRIDPAELEMKLRFVETGDDIASSGRSITVPVFYNGADLGHVADRLGLTTSQVIADHARRDYQVFAVGFLPGFPYAGYLSRSLAGLARRESPRARVPAGSVAIAGRQTGIYPAESPGGWHLLGTTPFRIVDFDRGHFPIQAGDRIRFMPITADEFEAHRNELLD